MIKEQILAFRYKGLFQLLEIRFFKTLYETSYKIECEANIQLPLLKKQYLVSTTFSQNLRTWYKHAPVFEKGADEHEIERNQNHGEVLDPIGFFMLLHEEDWQTNNVQLLIGQRMVSLDVIKTSTGYEVSRKDKNQKLVFIKGRHGIEKIEIPLPVIGTVSVVQWN